MSSNPSGSAATCVRCSATGLFEPCCSSHDAVMCHLCYRLTHFVEVCDCPTCLADGLPRIMRPHEIYSAWLGRLPFWTAVSNAWPLHLLNASEDEKDAWVLDHWKEHYVANA